MRAIILGFKVHAALLLGQPYTQQLCTWWLLRMISFYDWAPTQQSGTTGQQLVWGLAALHGYGYAVDPADDCFLQYLCLSVAIWSAGSGKHDVGEDLLTLHT